MQQDYPDVEIWYTLPVLPSGLTDSGLNVVESALAAGVEVDGVNIMAMDYGESPAPTTGPNAATMGEYSVDAAESTYDQLSTLYADYGQVFAHDQLGVTVMIGVNDITTEVFTTEDAQTLLDYANQSGLGMISLWSITRDNREPSANNQLRLGDRCSGRRVQRYLQRLRHERLTPTQQVQK